MALASRRHSLERSGERVSTLLLLSGGVDSLVVAETFRRAGHRFAAVFFDYDQPARAQEERAVLAYTGAHSIPLAVRHLLLSGMGEMTAPVGEGGPRVVPARNLVFIANAANMALTRGHSEIAFGANRADVAGYADCREAFVNAADIVCASLGVRVRAPLMFVEKAEIVRQAQEWGLSWWSCYTPTYAGLPCGSCNACTSNP